MVGRRTEHFVSQCLASPLGCSRRQGLLDQDGGGSCPMVIMSSHERPAESSGEKMLLFTATAQCILCGIFQVHQPGLFSMDVFRDALSCLMLMDLPGRVIWAKFSGVIANTLAFLLEKPEVFFSLHPALPGFLTVLKASCPALGKQGSELLNPSKCSITYWTGTGPPAPLLQSGAVFVHIKNNKVLVWWQLKGSSWLFLCKVCCSTCSENWE